LSCSDDIAHTLFDDLIEKKNVESRNLKFRSELFEVKFEFTEVKFVSNQVRREKKTFVTAKPNADLELLIDVLFVFFEADLTFKSVLREK